MPFNPRLAERVRAIIATKVQNLDERRMFGGVTFMVDGAICVGVDGDDLIVRCGKDRANELVHRPGAREFDLSARPMKGWLLVGPIGTSSDAELEQWIDRAIDFARGR